MISMLGTIFQTITDAFSDAVSYITPDILFFIFLAGETLFVLFFVFKSIFSYEARLNRALEKLNYWLFNKKTITEDNIREINQIFKTKTPKRLCYYWQQYILFREGSPSSYLSSENLIEKPLKTSSYESNIKNLGLFTTLWALITAMFAVVVNNPTNFLSGQTTILALLCPIFVCVIGFGFIIFLRFRKNNTLNSLYQNVALFGRFMDNACVDLPSYIDYQILFTPREIEKGQPVLREFLDYRSRQEKEEFNKAKVEQFDLEEYDFTSAGVDGSIVLDRAMKESERYLKKKEKILLQISQLEGSLESRRKNFDTVQKEYQTKIQASKENVDKLRQMQEETTNRIEANYYRKQQTQEIGKQEQLEQEFEQQRAKYLLEKNEGEEEISKLNAELQDDKAKVEAGMLSEYKTFFNKFCKSAEKVVGQVFQFKFDEMKQENERAQQRIQELEVKLKDVPQGVYDGSANDQPEGKYDLDGNYVFENGTYYDKNGNFHDENGDVYSQDGKLILKLGKETEEKKIVDLDSLNAFDFTNDTTQKEDIFDVAQDIVKNVNKDDDIEFVRKVEKPEPKEEPKEEKPTNKKAKLETVSLDDLESQEPKEEQKVETPTETENAANVDEDIIDFNNFEGLETQPVQQEEPVKTVEEQPQPAVNTQPEKPRKKAGRPRKIVTEPVEAKKRGRPRKEVTQPVPKRSVGRPRKIVSNIPEEPKRGRGRPKKSESIDEINQRLQEEEARINALRKALNQDLESAMNGMNGQNTDAKQSRRAELIKEIESLQKEAQQVIARNESESKIEEVNRRLEQVLQEIKNLNS